MALEPEWEAKLEPNTYGFRPGRSCHDAIEAIFDVLKQKTAYVLDADISGCLTILTIINCLKTTPTLKKIIRRWLRAGVMEDGKFQSTKRGTIQGGTVASLCCITRIRATCQKSINKRTLSMHEKKIW